MIPFGTETVTIVHRTGGGWISTAVNGCSFRQTRARTLNGKAADHTLETVCRIPAGSIVPAVGDVILPGAHAAAAAANEIELVRLLEALTRTLGVVILYISDNTFIVVLAVRVIVRHKNNGRRTLIHRLSICNCAGRKQRCK